MIATVLSDTTTVTSSDTVSVVTISALMMVMTVRLTLFSGGFMHSKNALNAMRVSMIAPVVISVPPAFNHAV